MRTPRRRAFRIARICGGPKRRRGERKLDSPPSKQRRVPRTVTCYAWAHVVTSRGPGAAKDGRGRGGERRGAPMPMWRSFDQSGGSGARHSRGAPPAAKARARCARAAAPPRHIRRRAPLRASQRQGRGKRAHFELSKNIFERSMNWFVGDVPNCHRPE